MYASSLRRVVARRGVGALLLLCGLLAQTRAWGSDFVTQTGQTPTDPLICKFDVSGYTQGQSWPSGLTGTVQISINIAPEYDTARDFQSSPLTAGYSSNFPPGSCPSGMLFAGVGANGARDFRGENILWPVTTTQGTGITSNGIDRSKNGQYNFTWSYFYNTQHTVSKRAWLINGVWTTDPPPPIRLPTPPDIDPYNADAPAYLTVRVWKPDLNTPGQDGYTVDVSGPDHFSGRTGNGKLKFGPLVPGNYMVTVTGPSGPNSGDSAQRNVTVNKGTNRVVDVVFNSAGSPSWTGGEDPNATGTGGGWLSDILRSLFVPRSSAIDGIKRSFNDFVNWGPMQLVTETANLANAPHGQQSVINIPVPMPYMRNDPRTPGDSSSMWYWNSAPVPLNDSGLTAAPGWAWVRLIMGAGVWIGFGLLLMRRMMPRNVV